MELRALLKLLVLFLGFSHLLSPDAVTATRSLRLDNEDPFSVQDFQAQDAMDLSESIEEEVMFGMEQQEGYEFERRMDIETTDYPGAGANNQHDPTTPARL